MVSLSGIEAGFGANVVLHGVDLSAEAGTSVGLFGLNGAGKSVTMKVIAGLLPERAGTVTMAGDDITSLSPEDRVARGMAYAVLARLGLGAPVAPGSPWSALAHITRAAAKRVWVIRPPDRSRLPATRAVGWRHRGNRGTRCA